MVEFDLFLRQYQEILDDPEEHHAERRLAALTAGDRYIYKLFKATLSYL